MTKAKQKREESSLWIYNPTLDLMVGCGAWSAPLLWFWYLSNTSALAWSATFYGLAIFFNYPHYMATLYRAYHTEEEFRKYRIFTVHITALILLTLVFSHFWYRALPWIFTIYLTWSPWHYSGQNYGLFMMFARRAGAKPSENGRQALYFAFLLSYLVLFLSFHTGPSRDPLFISLGIPEKLGMPLLLMLGLGFLLCSVYGIAELIKQVGWKPLIPSLTLFSTQFIWFLLPTVLAFGEGLRVTQSRYSTGVLAVMHSAQYLWITSYYAQREANAERKGGWRPLAYFGVLVGGGIALFVPGPWLASRIFHYDLTASFLLFSALVNIHHFILDGAIWKLRDGRIAALLLNSRDQLSSVTNKASSRLGDSARWLVGNSAGSRFMRIVALVLLLAWGTLDQIHFYLALHKDNLAYLRNAASLNAFDSAVQTQIGRKEWESGRVGEAVTSWQKALGVNPSATAPRDALLRYFAGSKHWDEAYALLSQTLAYSPKDVNLLVNRGVLAQQLGHGDEAIENWNRAVTVDPQQPLAHLYLANELDRQGQYEAAIPHYLAFLQQVSKSDAQSRPPAEEVIAGALRLAKCAEKAHRISQAEESYRLAQTIASQASSPKLESLAAIGEAALMSSQKNIPEALRLYQHALVLDRSAHDAHSESADWYSYGLFLRDAGFPERLSYACLLRAEWLALSLKDDSQLALVQPVRQEIEGKLGKSASGIRSDSLQVLEEALKVTAP